MTRSGPEHPLPPQERILRELEDLCRFMDQATRGLDDGLLCEFAPLADGVRRVCQDIGSLDKTTGRAFAPALEALLGRYDLLEQALVARARASGLDTGAAPRPPGTVRAAYERLGRPARPVPPPGREPDT